MIRLDIKVEVLVCKLATNFIFIKVIYLDSLALFTRILYIFTTSSFILETPLYDFLVLDHALSIKRANLDGLR